MQRLHLLLPALLALGSLAPLSAAIQPKTAEPLRISQGRKVDLTGYLVPGKTVIFDFTSEYCGPCRTYDEPLHELHTKRADFVVVKVDINRPGIERIDWQSPVAQQFDLHSIPHFKVYSPAGRLIAEDKIVFGPDGRPDRALSSSAGRRMVDAWIKGTK